MNRGPYRAPTVTVDVVSLRWADHALGVGTHRRARGPYEGEWALPGCYVYAGDQLEERCHAVLLDRLGVEAQNLRLVVAGDGDGRDERGPAVSFVYLETGVGGSYAECEPPTAFDHADLLRRALDRAASWSLDVVDELLPETFILSEAHALSCALAGRDLDRRNWNRQVRGRYEATNERVPSGGGRPATVYRRKI